MCDFLCKDTHIPAIKQQLRHRKCKKHLWGVEKLGVLNWKTRRAELKKSACRIEELGTPNWRTWRAELEKPTTVVSLLPEFANQTLHAIRPMQQPRDTQSD